MRTRNDPITDTSYKTSPTLDSSITLCCRLIPMSRVEIYFLPLKLHEFYWLIGKFLNHTHQLPSM